MKRLLILSLLLLSLVATVVAQDDVKGAVLTIRMNDYDTLKLEDTTILGYVFLKQFVFERDEGSAGVTVCMPTMDEVRSAEKLLRSKYFSIMPAERRDILGREFRPSLKSYVRQYVFGMGSDGNLYVWVNAVHNDFNIKHEELQSGLIMVRDGGNWFWKTLLNVTEGKVIWSMVNGTA